MILFHFLQMKILYLFQKQSIFQTLLNWSLNQAKLIYEDIDIQMDKANLKMIRLYLLIFLYFY